MGMPLLEVPIGAAAYRWVTVTAERTVLVVVHNATTLNRLRDVIGLFDADPRVQLVVTSCFSDPFTAGLDVEIDDLGLLFVPWPQAAQTQFDLIVTASHHGFLTELHGPLVILSHGIGYTKYTPGVPTWEGRSVFGLSPEWLLYNGHPIADALVFSHQEQLDRLAAEVPEALPTADLAGDPCYDRMLACRGSRGHYRAALGVQDDKTLVVASSTWGTGSLLGSSPQLLRRLVAELPVDSYRVAAILHPNIWHGHGPGQVRAWLADCVRAGLVLVPPREGWRAALIAADCVIGDHGSVTTYGAALGRPTLLAAFPDSEVAPGTAVHRLGRLAPRLRPGPVRPQLEATITDFKGYDTVTSLVSAVPGESPSRLRRLFYDLMHLAEPAAEPLLPTLPAGDLSPGTRPTALWVTATGDAPIHLERVPAFAGPEPGPRSGHLAVHHAHPSRQLLTAADVVFAYDTDVPKDPAGWLRAVDAPFAAVAGPHSCLLRTADTLWELSGDVEGTLLASAAYTWKGDLATGFDLAVNGVTHKVSVHAW